MPKGPSKGIAFSLFQYVFDSSSLINIERRRQMKFLRQRRAEIILPEKVAREVKQPGSPLNRFLDKYPAAVESFNQKEENIYLTIRAQPGIDDGEAAAIAIAHNRNLPLVIEDKKGKSKAENHGISCISSEDFVKGS
jgi:predicted nucleic acid-binding protein